MKSTSKSHNSTLQRLLTPARLSPYLSEVEQDLDDAIDLYLWNRDLSLALFADMALVEVAFRNAIDASLRATFQAPHWYWDGSLGGFSRRLESKTINKLKRVNRSIDKNSPINKLNPGKVVSELTLGFWVELLERPYEKELWLPSWAPKGTGIAHGMEGLTRLQRHPVYKLASLMQQTRNRVAHHEPVFNGVRRKGSLDRVPIASVHTEIVELAQVIHPAIAQQLHADSRFDVVLRAKP